MSTVAIVGAALSALMAGLFFAFSTFTMDGIRRIPPKEGLIAMQGINAAATASAPFLLVFIGGGLYCAVVGVIASTRLDEPAGPYLVAAAITNVLGIIITMTFHVPRNNALDRVDPDSPGADHTWRAHATTWVRGNHIRTSTYLSSTVAFAIALTRL